MLRTDYKDIDKTAEDCYEYEEQALTTIVFVAYVLVKVVVVPLKMPVDVKVFKSVVRGMSDGNFTVIRHD